MNFQFRKKPSKLEITDLAVRQIMISVASDAVYLAHVLSGTDAKQLWRNRMREACRGLLVDDGVCDHVFRFFQERWDRISPVNPLTGHKLTPAQWLEMVSPDEVRPKTQKEIDAAWKVESASSPEGRRFLYGGDGVPRLHMDQN